MVSGLGSVTAGQRQQHEEHANCTGQRGDLTCRGRPRSSPQLVSQFSEARRGGGGGRGKEVENNTQNSGYWPKGRIDRKSVLGVQVRPGIIKRKKQENIFGKSLSTEGKEHSSFAVKKKRKEVKLQAAVSRRKDRAG